MAASNPGGLRTEQESEGSTQSTADMIAFVQNLLVQMQTRFQAMSGSIVSKIDEMGSRIDELEQSINDLKTEIGAAGAIKPKPEEPRPPEESA
ncbi:heat shock factor-binding protein-like isoform X2 [Phoenix dactylifera]|uniref:Heat shock factor-binding protein-like isoform X2 n=1 Tax=Phoenix dactylifera TaxID=42345 RepID=A0A8B9ABZ1_PHODC|nr:heat shock factor-binding protein-like isoform X2 [Phoenix dactylifera]